MLTQRPPARSLPSLHSQSVHGMTPAPTCRRRWRHGRVPPANLRRVPEEIASMRRCRSPRVQRPHDAGSEPSTPGRDHVAHNNELARAFATSPDFRVMRISHHRQSNRCRSSPSRWINLPMKPRLGVLVSFRPVFANTQSKSNTSKLSIVKVLFFLFMPFQH